MVIFNKQQEQGITFLISSDCSKSNEIIRSVLMPIEESGYVYASTKRKDIYLGYQKSCFVKKYKLPGLYRKLHADQYAPREFSEISEVRRRGIDTPRIWAYFEVRVLKYLNIMNGICIEYIDNARPVKLEELDKIVSCAVDLYRKGIFHPDFNPMNLLTSDLTDSCIPIDFIGSRFCEKSSIMIPILNIARFIQYTKLVNSKIQDQLLQKIITYIPELLFDETFAELRDRILKFADMDLSNDKLEYLFQDNGMKTIFDLDNKHVFLH